MKLVLATIPTKYELKLVSDRPELPQRRGVTLAPQTGIKMILQNKRKVEPQQQLSEIS